MNGLRRQRPDVHPVLVTGARWAHRVVAPFGVACIQLPSVVKVANGRYVVDGEAASVEEVMLRRSNVLADAVRDLRPDLLLVDRYPRGMHDELACALGVYAAEQPGAPAVLGLRDILDTPPAIRQEWQAQGHSEAIRDTYQTVLCYGDPAVYDPVREYGLPDDVAARIRFTGYLADDLRAADALEVRRRHEAGDRRLAVCTLGGGKDAASIAQAFLEAMDHLGVQRWTGVLITGPYMARADVDRLRRHPATARVSIIEMVDDVPSYLAAADAAVCMGGYNTICEVLGLAVPAVIIPRVRPRLEQRMRAERLGARGLVRWIEPTGLSARVLAANIESVATLPRVDLVGRIATVAHRGVQTAAWHLAALLPVRSVEGPMRHGAGQPERSQVAGASR